MLLPASKSLRSRYAVWTFFLSAFLATTVLLCFAIFSYRLLLKDYRREIEQRLQIMAVSLQRIIASNDYLGMTSQINSLLLTRGVEGVRILDSNNQLLMYKGIMDGLLIEQPIPGPEGPRGMVQASFSRDILHQERRALLSMALTIILITTPLAALLTWLVAGRQVKDIVRLTGEISKLGATENEYLNLPGSDRQDEIGVLAQTLAEQNRRILRAKKLQHLLYQAINQTHDSVVITDEQARIEYVNPAFSRITGYAASEVIGKNPNILHSGKHPKAFYQQMWKRLQQGKTWQGIIINKRKDGEEYQEEATITPVIDEQGNIHHYVALKRDVTKEALLEKKLARAEKMQAIGLMAGGVAHDLNNILSGLIGYPELLLLKLPPDSDLRPALQAIEESGKRAAEVVSDLLTIARGVAAPKEIANLNDLIKQYLASPDGRRLKTMRPEISIVLDLAPDLLNLLCSPAHIGKCLMNLVINGAEAITGAGQVTITTRNSYIDKPVAKHQYMKKGEYVVLSISDTGNGIDPADLEHIFEPFYSKKVLGRSGTGLGLAVVWNTVQDHDGVITVESGKQGSCFTLYFPATRDGIETLADDLELKDLRGNNERILIIDDDAMQRDITARMLDELNYKTVTAASGEEALRILKEKHFDLVLLDMIMNPGMDGYETYRKILELHPGQKAVIVSGFSRSVQVRKTQALGAELFVKKPFSLIQIGDAVRKSLSAGTRPEKQTG